MERTCARAVALGLPAVAFTEHADYTSWMVPGTSDEMVIPPELDLRGYLDRIQRCRDLFPDLRILSGLELGEPHWHGPAVVSLLSGGRFDLVLGSLHCLPFGQRYREMSSLYQQWPADTVVRKYLAEIPHLIAGSDAFSVLAHIDYPLRYWPAEAGPFDPAAFQEEFRYALRALAESGRALEINTEVPLHREIIRWWHDVGGTAVTFGSDAHEPDKLARRFSDAAALAAACGFRPGPGPCEPWARA
jgi:histidinol-phosphatase (PHP family)